MGVTYGFLSGQPLTILGSTGPILVFETIMFDFCKSVGFQYLPFRFWDAIQLCRYIQFITMYSAVQKNSCMFEFPAFLQRAADAQPIGPDGTCVTELSKVFLLDPVYHI